MNTDLILLTLDQIVCNVKECVKYADSIDYTYDYEKIIYELLNILDDVHSIRQEIKRKPSS